MKSRDFPCGVAPSTRNYGISLDGKILRDSTPLACGTHSLVYRGTLCPDGRVAAVKIVSRSDEKVIKEILLEAHIASKMRHPNVLPLFGITTAFGLTVSLMTGWMEGGDAHQYVQQRDRDPRPLIGDIALGLHYLHTYSDGPIIHGNLNGHNVLVSAIGHATLTDFGYCMFSNPSFAMTTESPFGGTLQWKAPELVDTESAENCRATEESDVWAFGMTTLELFTAKVPHRNLAERPAIVSRILCKPPGRPSNKDTCARMTDEWWELISRCVRMEPSSRIEMLDAIEKIKQLKFPLRPTQYDDSKFNQSNSNAFSDVPHRLAQRASRYVFDLDDWIEREPSPCCHGGGTLIYRGKLLSDGRTVAIKTPRGIGMDDERTIKQILKEAHTWSKLDHPNVLSVLGITTKFDSTVSIVTLWMEGGNASAYVQKQKNDPRPLIKDIALGLRYLHSHPEGPIIHADLKGENVLVASDGRAVLTDFGLSILPNSSFSIPMTSACGGSLRWMAPEVVNRLVSEDPKPTVEGEIWAFGMTTLELFTRKHPYWTLTNRDSIQSRVIMGPPERPSREDTCYRMTNEWWDLCSRCLRMDPSSRFGAGDIVKETREVSTVVLNRAKLKSMISPCQLPPSACAVFFLIEAETKIEALVLLNQGMTLLL
ncbi:kinase-like domain-containing protein [Pisolithus orientalis]|uniref:kinase-like domain-containing protein n=1 Tax=Pisolithus orientalis TaxID=936130 RepID=UPI002224B82E|nr:kinase-like domain-containing protein [Pisolithus orientalis]KAI6006311.1 kinase-like domain-containing protein [Pisolithus orientalis]